MHLSSPFEMKYRWKNLFWTNKIGWDPTCHIRLQSSFVVFIQACIFFYRKAKNNMITNCRKLFKRALFTDCRRALSSCIYNVSKQKWLQTRAGGRYENLWWGGINIGSLVEKALLLIRQKIWGVIIPLPPTPVPTVLHTFLRLWGCDGRVMINMTNGGALK